MLIIPSSGCSVPAYLAAASSDARRVTLSLNTYQYTHGKLPDSLHELQDMMGDEADLLKFHDRREERYYDWLYFGRDYLSQKPHEFIVLASPLPYVNRRFIPNNEGERIASFLDGHVEIMEESEFRAAIRKQRQSVNADEGHATPAANEIDALAKP